MNMEYEITFSRKLKKEKKNNISHLVSSSCDILHAYVICNEYSGLFTSIYKMSIA